MNIHDDPGNPSRRRCLQGSLAALSLAALPVSNSCVAASDPAALLRLDLNESSYGPSPRVAAAITQALPELPRYVLDSQAQALQRQIAVLEGVAPEQVVLGEMLPALGQYLALEHGGGGFIYSLPGYGALVDAATAVAGRAVQVPLDAQLRNDLPALAAAIDADTRALFVVNPHNPSGTLSGRDEFDAFVLAAAKRTLVIVDEAYLDYCEDFSSRTAVRLLRAGSNVLVFRTLGKLHALAGLQMGYALAPPALAATLQQRGVGGAHVLNQLALVAAAASLSDPQHRLQVQVTVAREREQWRLLLRELGLVYAEPSANFVFFEAGRPHALLAAEFLRRGIRIGREFSPYTHWLRITIGTPSENAQAKTALREILQLS